MIFRSFHRSEYICGGLTLANSQTLTQCLVHSPLLWVGDKMEGQKTHGLRWHLMVAWEENCHNPKCPLFLLLSLSFYYLVQCHMAWNIVFFISGTAALAVSPPILLPILSLLARGRKGERKPWHCPSTIHQQPKHWCYLQCFSHKHKTQHRTYCSKVG